MLLNSSFNSSNERDIYGYNCAVVDVYSNDSKIRWSREKEYIFI